MFLEVYSVTKLVQVKLFETENPASLTCITECFVYTFLENCQFQGAN